ncbi:hypothetical protein VKT23_014422 [Stygiomarasmius scandens]|uniref:Uncharacterized protein n=1 Tax=Marasmiellus scandens TaxID=2682957 RepID=A0ABR1J438_9AGAR
MSKPAGSDGGYPRMHPCQALAEDLARVSTSRIHSLVSDMMSAQINFDAAVPLMHKLASDLATAKYRAAASLSFVNHVDPTRFDTWRKEQQDSDGTKYSSEFISFLDEIPALEEEYGFKHDNLVFDDHAGVSYDLPSSILPFLNRQARHGLPDGFRKLPEEAAASGSQPAGCKDKGKKRAD